MTNVGEEYLGAWLGERLLMVAGPERAVGERTTPIATIDDRRLAVETEIFQPRGGAMRPAPNVLLLRFSNGLGGGSESRVELKIGKGTLTLRRERTEAPAMDLSALLRARLAHLDAATRAELLDFIVRTSAADLEGVRGVAVAKRLKLVRDVLRERLPVHRISEDQTQGLYINHLLAIDSRHFWVKGWIWEADAAYSELVLVSPEGVRASILDSVFRHRRRDVEEIYAKSDCRPSLNGFLGFVTLPSPTRISSGWTAELHSESGEIEASATNVVRGPVSVRDMILRDFGEADREPERLIADHAHTAMSLVLEKLAARVDVDRVFQHGDAPDDPQTSIVVALGSHVDALEHQLRQFRADPEIDAADLIYLIYTAETSEELASCASELHWLYPVPFRLVTLTDNAGPAVASAIGASLARGRRLLFLNPDVLPDRPGWLGTMSAFYDAQDRIGALGPKLLYEDDSLQHAGLGFERASSQEYGIPASSTRTAWEARSFFKGLPADLAEANEARQVPAVSGACMLVDRDLYESVGGLSNVYVDGEYEDVDLCHRLTEAGRSNWYLPEAALYHHQGRSNWYLPEAALYHHQGRSLVELHRPARRYNVLLHSYRWRDRIEESDGP